MSHQQSFSRRNSGEPYIRRYGTGPVGRFYSKHCVPTSAVIAEFNYVKYFRQDEREPPPTLNDLLAAKLDPAPQYQSGFMHLSPRTDFILPRCAPRDIHCVSELIDHFDRVPALRRDVMVEMKFISHADVPAHLAYKCVRAFALEHLAYQRQLAAILVQHLPSRSGSHRSSHVHMFTPARQLTINGFGPNAGNLVHDEGEAQVCAAWLKHVEQL